MADRYDREYDRDRSRWRDVDNEGEWNRGDRYSREYGGSTRRGWGRFYEPGEGPEAGYGRGYGTEYDSGYGRSARDYDRDYYGTGSWRGYNRGDYARGMERGYDQGERYRGPDYARGMERGYDREEMYRSPNYARGMERGYDQGERYRGPDYARGMERGSERGGTGRGYGRGRPVDYERDYGTYRGDWGDEDYYEPEATWSYAEFWLVPGPYTGVGPSDYTRSPDRLREDVIERLTQHGRLNASDIHVDVNDQCEVTLSGQVDRRQEKRMAEDAAESVWGVTDVHNQIKVRGREERPREGQSSGQGMGQQRSGQSGGYATGQSTSVSELPPKS